MMIYALLAAASLTAPAPRDESAKPAPTGEVVPAPAATAATIPASGTNAAAKPTRYCFLNVQEDHIVRGKVCRTRAQWLWHDVDPLDYLGRKK